MRGERGGQGLPAPHAPTHLTRLVAAKQPYNYTGLCPFLTNHNTPSRSQAPYDINAAWWTQRRVHAVFMHEEVGREGSKSNSPPLVLPPRPTSCIMGSHFLSIWPCEAMHDMHCTGHKSRWAEKGRHPVCFAIHQHTYVHHTPKPDGQVNTWAICL